MQELSILWKWQYAKEVFTIELSAKKHFSKYAWVPVWGPRSTNEWIYEGIDELIWFYRFPDVSLTSGPETADLGIWRPRRSRSDLAKNRFFSTDTMYLNIDFSIRYCSIFFCYKTFISCIENAIRDGATTGLIWVSPDFF